MRAGITLADKIHTVSPSYAQEIQRPSFTARGIYGGEGLEQDLILANAQGKLVGILNGCEYPPGRKYKIENKNNLANIILESLIGWVSKNPLVLSCHWVAQNAFTCGCKIKSAVLSSPPWAASPGKGAFI